MRPVIGFDTETHLIRRGRLVPRLVCTTFAGTHDAPRPSPPKHGTYLRDETDHGWRMLLDRRASIEIVPRVLAGALEGEYVLAAHNAAFDLAVWVDAWETAPASWRAPDPDPRADRVVRDVIGALDYGRILDTGVREMLVRIATGTFRFKPDPARPGSVKRTKFDLAELVLDHFGVDLSGAKTDSDAWRLRYSALDGVPVGDWPEAAREYALADAEWARNLVLAQGAEPLFVGGYPVVDEDGSVVDEVPQVRAAFALHCMSAWGLRTDPGLVAETVSRWREIADRGREIGEREGWIRVRGRDKGKPGSVNKVRLQARVVEAYAARGLHAPRSDPSASYPEGQVRTAEEVLVDSKDPILVEYAESIQATTWTTKYAAILEAGTAGPITSRPNVLVRSGRTSWSDPPLQQPPRSGGYREAHVPRPGWAFVSVDYDAIELCALAQIHIDWGLGSTLADAINAGQDPHVLMAADILNAEGVPGPAGGAWDYDLAAAARRGVYGAAPAATVKEYRQLAKAANFGFPGGLGPDAFVAYAHATYGVDLDPDRAAALKALWLGRWPEMRGYFDRITRSLGYGDSFAALQPVSGRVRGSCGFTDGANTYFQGRVADGAKAAAWVLCREALATPSSPFYGCRPVLFLHDEIVSEIPLARLDEAGTHKARVMVETMRRYIPDVRVSAEPAAMFRWYKDAETVRVDGRLVPWEPRE
jgi:DNA polymerase-1